jgi:hypothetical protein
MYVITTKYLSPTNNRGARIKATVSHRDISITDAFDYGLSAKEAHESVAMHLAMSLDWDSYKFAVGDHGRGGYVFVPIAETNIIRAKESI